MYYYEKSPIRRRESNRIEFNNIDIHYFITTTYSIHLLNATFISLVRQVTSIQCHFFCEQCVINILFINLERLQTKLHFCKAKLQGQSSLDCVILMNL